MVEINSSFIGLFKLGDNINHNLKIVRELYGHLNTQGGEIYFKPITITLISIIEAVLYDFHKKPRIFSKEGIKGLPATVVEYIRNRQYDKLEHYIVSAKKHDLFDLADTDFYAALDELRRLRNRIHIQNEKNDFEADEAVAFSRERMVQAEMVLEKVLLVMHEKYSRGENFTYVENFVLPWDSHFPET